MKEAIWRIDGDMKIKMEDIIRCRDCEFAGDNDGEMICSHPRNGGWHKRTPEDFCSLAIEKEK